MPEYHSQLKTPQFSSFKRSALLRYFLGPCPGGVDLSYNLLTSIHFGNRFVIIRSSVNSP